MLMEEHLSGTEAAPTTQKSAAKPRNIKCVVWDLDNTLWDGILLEDGEVRLRSQAIEVIKTLDARGILHSIASKNDEATAMAKLAAFGLSEYFLYPQIHWSSKVVSLQSIASSLNIGIDAIAFVDDTAFERDEVAFTLPEVLCIDATHIASIPDMPAMSPRFLTKDAANRRKMYSADIKRNKAEDIFQGPKEEFLATLGMVYTLSSAREEDLLRAEELTQRTHQLNTTGITYSYEELLAFHLSEHYKLLMADLEDTYGSYGKIGLSLIECSPDLWILKLFLMSCRVMSKGVGSVMLYYIMNLAKRANVRLYAEFLPNKRNRQMYITYRLNGFKEVGKRNDDLLILEHDLVAIPSFPPYVTVNVDK